MPARTSEVSAPVVVVETGKRGTEAVAGISEVTVMPAGVLAGGRTLTAGAAALTARAEAAVVVTTAATLEKGMGNGTAKKGMQGAAGIIKGTGKKGSPCAQGV